jgi:hypothetical protein
LAVTQSAEAGLFEAVLKPGVIARRRVYPMRALFLLGLVGNLFGVIIVVAMNSFRLGRLLKDLPFLLGVVLPWAGLVLGLSVLKERGVIALEPLLLEFPMGLLTAFFGYRLHRTYYRAQEVANRVPPSSLRLCLIAYFVGRLVEAPLFIWPSTW